jgi:hypothetical protein
MSHLRRLKTDPPRLADGPGDRPFRPGDLPFPPGATPFRPGDLPFIPITHPFLSHPSYPSRSLPLLHLRSSRPSAVARLFRNNQHPSRTQTKAPSRMNGRGQVDKGRTFGVWRGGSEPIQSILSGSIRSNQSWSDIFRTSTFTPTTPRARKPSRWATPSVTSITRPLV